MSELIVHNYRRGNSKHRCQEDLRPRSVRQGQDRLCLDDERDQLESANQESKYLEQFALPEMSPYPLVLKAISISKAACLGAISRGENDGKSLLLQLSDDGLEERDVWRVVQIDPDRLILQLFSLIYPNNTKSKEYDKPDRNINRGLSIFLVISNKTITISTQITGQWLPILSCISVFNIIKKICIVAIRIFIK